jgi:hypothetical protein
MAQLKNASSGLRRYSSTMSSASKDGRSLFAVLVVIELEIWIGRGTGSSRRVVVSFPPSL